MLITIDTEKDSSDGIRAVIGFLAHIYDLDTDETEVPSGTKAHLVTVPPPPGRITSEQLVADETNNVVNFPVPPPSPAAVAAFQSTSVGTAAVYTPNSSAAVIAADVANVVSAPAEYDSAGLPWDARIHQKKKSQKKDGTWKLQKGLDNAIVMAIMPELIARKISAPASPSMAVGMPVTGGPNGPATITSVLTGSVPPPPPLELTGPGKFGVVSPPPEMSSVGALQAGLFGAAPPPPATVAPQVLLPGNSPAPGTNTGNSVPLPPIQADPTTPNVPAQIVAAYVPVPPIAATGPMGVITYRTLIDKMTAGTRTQTLTAAKVMEIVQSCGCPNLQQLNQMPAIFADLDAKIDLALAGLL